MSHILVLLGYLQVAGFDFSRDQLLVASSRQDLQRKACYKNIVWIEGDALNLPFTESSAVSILDFNKSSEPFTCFVQEWMIDNVVVPVATSYGLPRNTGRELEKLALEVGFSHAKHYETGGDLMGNLVATR
ncbi:hypothetical protein GIB67_014055 [Kingdonia uniflora]|uniref:Uncharacterized protein n=1 Tax=Kingdonia uniflora TaxID=39325 RepID=A0A7J7KXD2_9MAGN|nr:hypothetical protein GIB67_014055 [Kingdonia uniflora]